MGDSVPKHTRPTSLTDTHPRTELSEPERPPPEKILRWEALFTGEAQAACRCNCWGSKLTPFFQRVRVIVTIFRARVRRAIVGRIPLATRAT